MYNGSTNQWDSFSFRIEKKVKKADDYVTFLVYNNANQKSYIDVKVSETEGFILMLNTSYMQAHKLLVG